MWIQEQGYNCVPSAKCYWHRRDPYLNKELKYRILENAEGYLIEFYQRNSGYFDSSATLTIENVFPRYFKTVITTTQR